MSEQTPRAALRELCDLTREMKAQLTATVIL